MRILVVGAGSTGGYFGGRLAQAGRDVTFLVRPGRAAYLREKGLQIISPNGDVTLTPQLVTAGEIDASYDAILLTVKAFSLEGAFEDFAPAVERETMILPVLNGMRHVDVLAARFGEKAVLGCVCKVATMVDEEGRIVQLAKFQELAYGEMKGVASARTEELDAFMQGAGFDAKLSSTIEREMWEKWVLLAALGGVTCPMRGSIGEIMAAPGGEEFVLPQGSDLGGIRRRTSADRGFSGEHQVGSDYERLPSHIVDVSRSARRPGDRKRPNHRGSSRQGA
jgi:2-dehydropantoate 2-reductase